MKNLNNHFLWILALGIGLFLHNRVFAQQDTLTLDQCYKLAEQNYPLTQQRDLLAKSTDYTVANAAKGFLPQVAINGQATYQSDVTEIPINFPGVNIPTISKDQYKVYGEVYEPLTDLYTISQRKKSEKISAELSQQNLEVDLYKLKERINQLFFGILLIDGQLEQNEILRSDIQSVLDKTTAAVNNGMALKSNASELKAELMGIDQHTVELKANRQAFADMLSLFIGKPVNEKVKLIKPSETISKTAINRPELMVFNYQQQNLKVQSNLVTSKTLPKFSLFFQGGYGKPSPVNLLSPDWSSYYITGIKLNWSLSAFYTSHKEKQILNLNQQMLNTQRETFLFNTQLNVHQQNADIQKLGQLVATDDSIISLREDVSHTADVQYQNGAITVTDFLQKANAADKARQNKILHEIQFLQVQYNLKTTTGN